MSVHQKRPTSCGASRPGASNSRISHADIGLLAKNALGKTGGVSQVIERRQPEALLDLLDNGVFWTEPVGNRAAHGSQPIAEVGQRSAFMDACKKLYLEGGTIMTEGKPSAAVQRRAAEPPVTDKFTGLQRTGTRVPDLAEIRQPEDILRLAPVLGHVVGKPDQVAIDTLLWVYRQVMTAGVSHADLAVFCGVPQRDRHRAVR